MRWTISAKSNASCKIFQHLGALHSRVNAMVRLAKRKRSLFLPHHGGLRASPIVGADVDEVREI